MQIIFEELKVNESSTSSKFDMSSTSLSRKLSTGSRFSHPISEIDVEVTEEKETNNRQNEISQELSYEESEIRLISLGIILSLGSLICATAFSSIVYRISGYYKDPLVVPFKNQTLKSHGLPVPTILAIDSSGNLSKFSPITNRIENGLPQLPRLEKDSKPDIVNIKHHVQIFAAEYKDHLYFMYPSPRMKVVKYNLVHGSHQKVERSHPPFYHLSNACGTKIGKYFWIILGADAERNTEIGQLGKQLKSSIWSFEKETWFEGPNLQHLPKLEDITVDYCMVTVNLSTVYIYLADQLFSYNFELYQWVQHSFPQYIPQPFKREKFVKQYNFNITPRSCTFYQSKSYSRYILIQGTIWERNSENGIKWYFRKYDIENDIWASWTITTPSNLWLGNIVGTINGQFIQMKQSSHLSNLEIRRITHNNFTQELLFHRGSINYFSIDKDSVQTSSTLYFRKYQYFNE